MRAEQGCRRGRVGGWVGGWGVGGVQGLTGQVREQE